MADAAAAAASACFDSIHIHTCIHARTHPHSTSVAMGQSEYMNALEASASVQGHCHAASFLMCFKRASGISLEIEILRDVQVAK